MRRSAVPALAAILSLSACVESPAGSLRPSFFSAAVRGAVETIYEGTGEFHTGTPGPGQSQFQITSTGTGEMSNHSFALTRWDGGRLGTGRYPLALVAINRDDRRQPKGITFQYFVRSAGRIEQYVADSGEVEITHSSSDRVEGKFSLHGIRYCAREIIRSNPPVPPEGPCELPATAIAGAPEITITGSFAAVPLKVTGGIRELR